MWHTTSTANMPKAWVECIIGFLLIDWFVYFFIYSFSTPPFPLSIRSFERFSGPFPTPVLWIEIVNKEVTYNLQYLQYKTPSNPCWIGHGSLIWYLWITLVSILQYERMLNKCGTTWKYITCNSLPQDLVKAISLESFKNARQLQQWVFFW